jgi:hypothetical protein
MPRDPTPNVATVVRRDLPQRLLPPCRMIRDQERLLAGLEAAGLVRLELELLWYAGRRWFAVEGDAT